MKLEYKKLRLRTKEDFKKAEKLQSQGWKIINVGWDNILMEK